MKRTGRMTDQAFHLVRPVRRMTVRARDLPEMGLVVLVPLFQRSQLVLASSVAAHARAFWRDGCRWKGIVAIRALCASRQVLAGEEGRVPFRHPFHILRGLRRGLGRLRRRSERQKVPGGRRRLPRAAEQPGQTERADQQTAEPGPFLHVLSCPGRLPSQRQKRFRQAGMPCSGAITTLEPHQLKRSLVNLE